MIEVETALQKLKREIVPQTTCEQVSLIESCGRICGEDIFASLAVPNFPRAAMDGYAVIAKDTKGACPDKPVHLAVSAAVFAGDTCTEKIKGEKIAVRIMTGAPIPAPFDAVVKQEWTDYGEKQVAIYHEATPYLNYSAIGEDICLNQKLIGTYERMNSRTIGILATQGIEKIKVLLPMKIGIVTTGNEVTALDHPISIGKIYNSNAYMLASYVQASGSSVLFRQHCADSPTEIAEMIKKRMNDVDLLLTTGGVSVGEKDYLPKAMQLLQAKRLFHFVNMKPGTPVMASIYKQKIILSLSGNPFAALMNLHVFYWEVLAHFLHNTSFALKQRQVQLKETLPASPMRRFLQAYEEEGWVTLTTRQQFSSAISLAGKTNCFVDQPAKTSLKKGAYIKVYDWKE